MDVEGSLTSRPGFSVAGGMITFWKSRGQPSFKELFSISERIGISSC